LSNRWAIDPAMPTENLLLAEPASKASRNSDKA
jgi:hypothetical protein